MLAEVLAGSDQWSGSLQDLADEASRIVEAHAARHGVHLRPPSRSLVVDYRSAGLISPAQGKRYSWKHLVQLVVGCALVQGGLSRKEAARRLRTLSPSEAIALLESRPVSTSISILDEPATAPPEDRSALAGPMLEEAVRLLAAGLVHHFRRAREGDPLIHGAELSPWLKGAMMRIASLYVMHGIAARHDGAHTLVAQCLRPLRAIDWDLPSMDLPGFPFRGMRLLDPDTRLPTLDCIELARQTASELDLREQMVFAHLNSVCDQFASRGDETYSSLREFVARHPITNSEQIRQFLQDNSMQLATAFLTSCYEPVQPHHLVRGALHRCNHCHAPMGASTISGYVACRSRQCKAFDTPIASDTARQTSVDETLIAKAHVLVYWCSPGLDEVDLYDSATRAGLDVVLYPGRDKCDLGLDGNAIGIDVKSHTSPFLLAEALNRGIGGLALFPRKIIAVNDQSIARFEDYLDIVRRECVRDDVEIIAVSSLRLQLETHA